MVVFDWDEVKVNWLDKNIFIEFWCIGLMFLNMKDIRKASGVEMFVPDEDLKGLGALKGKWLFIKIYMMRGNNFVGDKIITWI